MSLIFFLDLINFLFQTYHFFCFLMHAHQFLYKNINKAYFFQKLLYQLPCFIKIIITSFRISKMFSIQEIQQDTEDKPPSFFYPAHKDQTSAATKIMECLVSIETLNHKKIPAEFILYEQCIAAKISGQIFIFETDLTVTFEAISESNQIKFLDSKRELQMKVIFKNQKEYEQFFTEIKRSLFQTDFESKYEMHGIIGSGVTGKVFKAKKIGGSETIFAVKCCSNISSQVLRQIQVLKMLEHPNLIYFHQMFLSKGKVYLILDYQDGGTLLQKIKQDQFPTMKEKIKFLVDMLNAFEFLRIKGIIHRDLKPQNILYSKKDDCYKITDFCLAIFKNELINKIVGTPGYLAPQSLDLESQIPYSHYSDVYSLGLIYFEMYKFINLRATKKRYINGENVEAILRKNKKPRSLKKAKYLKEHISDLEYDILRMMIRSEVDDRLLSVEILQSSELRKLVKDYSLDKKSQKSSSTSSENKETKRKDSTSWQVEQTIQEDKFMESVKKVLRIKSDV